VTPVPVRVIVRNIPDCCLLRGDFDSSGGLSVGDVTAMVAYLFRSGPPSLCPAHADVDGSGAVNVTDATRLIGYLFRGGPAPAACP